MDVPRREEWAEFAEFLAKAVIEKMEQRESVNALADLVIERLLETPDEEGTLTAQNARAASERHIETLPAYPGAFDGRGIVICGGGVTYFTNAYVTIRLLRDLGCRLPIQLWHLGPEEVDAPMKTLVAPFGVECVDALAVQKEHPARILRGWEIKPSSLLHSPFREVLYLDADNVPAADPTFLFETPPFKENGAVFWPDVRNMPPSHPAWSVFGVPYRDEPEWESGQILVDKERCWKALSLSMWYNEHSDFYYRVVYGDKDTFHMAFRKLNQPCALLDRVLYDEAGVIYQHDFDGNRLFQHRAGGRKWSLREDNPPILGFLHEERCRTYLRELQSLWDGVITPP